MRFHILALCATAVVLGACGGGEKGATDTTKAPPAATTPTPTPTPAPAATGGTGTATMAPATGKTVEVKMYGDDKGYRFEPADVTIKTGDAIKFTVVNGQPHNVAFDPATVPADIKAQLDANMPSKMAELQSPLMTNAGDSYTISFGNVKPGKIPYHCTPHLAMNMKGTITVQ
jgi:plastocyanin